MYLKKIRTRNDAIWRGGQDEIAALNKLCPGRKWRARGKSEAGFWSSELVFFEINQRSYGQVLAYGGTYLGVWLLGLVFDVAFDPP